MGSEIMNWLKRTVRMDWRSFTGSTCPREGGRWTRGEKQVFPFETLGSTVTCSQGALIQGWMLGVMPGRSRQSLSAAQPWGGTSGDALAFGNSPPAAFSLCLSLFDPSWLCNYHHCPYFSGQTRRIPDRPPGEPRGCLEKAVSSQVDIHIQSVSSSSSREP